MIDPPPAARPVAARTGGDRCPGLLRPYVAADGAIVRLRVPGGYVATETLVRLTEIAAEFGAPTVLLTSRANLQLRELPNPLPENLIRAIEATGTVPSASHERVRNIVADPLAPALRPLVEDLDARLCADPELAGLSGRWLFALAETGSVLATPWDLAYDVRSGTLHVGNHSIACARTDAVEALLDRARTFLRTRGDERQWNVRDLPADHPIFAGLCPTPRPVGSPIHPGRYGDTLVAGVPSGLLTTALARTLADLVPDVRVTPWRSVALETPFVPAGFITNDSSTDLRSQA